MQENFTLIFFLRVEYTDVFGRTRKIPRTDLEKIRKQDDDLKEEAEARNQQMDSSNREAPSPKSLGQLPNDGSDHETIIGPDIGLQFLKQREEWQKQEEINKERPTMHYQDVLFDGKFYTKHLFSYFLYFRFIETFENGFEKTHDYDLVYESSTHLYPNLLRLNNSLCSWNDNLLFVLCWM